MFSFLLSLLLTIGLSAQAIAGEACAAGAKDGFNSCLLNPNLPFNGFSIINPTFNAKVSGVMLVSGLAGKKWKNVGVFKSTGPFTVDYAHKIGPDTRPINGTYSIPVNTATFLANGTNHIAVVAFDSPAGVVGGAPLEFFTDVIVGNGGGTYYVSSTGSDSNAGSSTSAPWQTISKVNSFHFASGDALRFNGGQNFTGCLVLRPANVGINFSVGSYGTGNATITSNCLAAPQTETAAIIVDGISGFVLDGLIIRGAAAQGTPYGILLENNSNTTTQNVTIMNADISGFQSEIYFVGFPFSVELVILTM